MFIGFYLMIYSNVATYVLISLHVLGCSRGHVDVNEVTGRYCGMSPFTLNTPLLSMWKMCFEIFVVVLDPKAKNISFLLLSTIVS